MAIVSCDTRYVAPSPLARTDTRGPRSSTLAAVVSWITPSLCGWRIVTTTGPRAMIATPRGVVAVRGTVLGGAGPAATEASVRSCSEIQAVIRCRTGDRGTPATAAAAVANRRMATHRTAGFRTTCAATAAAH